MKCEGCNREIRPERIYTAMHGEMQLCRPCLDEWKAMVIAELRERHNAAKKRKY